MAGRETADIVFCMDASGSMSPTFEGVRNHVLELLDSLKTDLQRSWDVRFDFLAYKTAYNCDGKAGMVFDTVKKRNMEVLDGLYRGSGDVNGGSSSGFFTSDVNVFRTALQKVECDGDETSAPAIDMAADFPFRDAATCHRVVILLTDERMEDGTCVQKSNSKLAKLTEKLQNRGIMLYMVTPQSDMYDTLSQTDKSEWMVVSDNSGGLSNVDFGKLMKAIGKSVSVSQTGKGAAADPNPLFNETKWSDSGECVKTDMEE